MLLLFLSLTINTYICNQPICAASDIAIADVKLNTLYWMLGEWQREGKNAVVIESWIKTDDFRYEGKSIKIQNEDTTVLELLQLKQIGDDIFYIADVKQNSAPVKFKLISQTDFSAVFENKDHDFPQQISYQLNNNDLKATISGPGKDGKIKSIDFNFKKKIN